MEMVTPELQASLLSLAHKTLALFLKAKEGKVGRVSPPETG